MNPNLSIQGERRRTRIDPNLVDYLNQKYPEDTKEHGGEEKNTMQQEQGNTSSSDFSLEDLTEFYRINGVNYRNNICTLDLSKALLPSKTQEQHAKDRNKAINNNEFYTPDYPLFHSIITALKQNKDSQYKQGIEEIRQFIKKSAIEHWLITLTRIQYNPKGKDRIIHNYKQSDKDEKDIDSFIGPDGYIKNTTNVVEPLQALLDTKQSIQEINEVYKWLTDVDAYLFRLNSKPKNINKRVARFGDSSGRAGLDCLRYPEDSNSSLGVFACAEGTPTKK